jgi:hypothetical protein
MENNNNNNKEKDLRLSIDFLAIEFKTVSELWTYVDDHENKVAVFNHQITPFFYKHFGVDLTKSMLKHCSGTLAPDSGLYFSSIVRTLLLFCLDKEKKDFTPYAKYTCKFTHIFPRSLFNVFFL